MLSTKQIQILKNRGIKYPWSPSQTFSMMDDRDLGNRLCIWYLCFGVFLGLFL